MKLSNLTVAENGIIYFGNVIICGGFDDLNDKQLKILRKIKTEAQTEVINMYVRENRIGFEGVEIEN